MLEDGQTIDLDQVRKTTAYQKRKKQWKDRNWRLDNFYFIQNEEGDTIQFVRNAAQRAFCDESWSRDLLTKARQLGFSTEILIEILDLCVFRSGQTCGVIDVTLKDARKKLAKIKFAYDRLPNEIKVNVPLKKSNTEELEWENGSSVTVGVSYRGGTLQFLHVSEFGKISVNSPDVAREIKTGAMRAVHSTGRIVVESTAHGTAGEFYDMVKLAEDKMRVGEPLTSLDFRPHFFGWWMKPEYRLPNNLVVITQELEDYFRKLAPVLKDRHGLVLDADQMAWYAKQYADLGPDDVKAEMPTVREEAFYNSLVGAFWKRELSRAREDGRIGQMVPFDPTRRVNTFWDIGEDTTAIWWHQTDGIRHRLIDYYEEEGWSLQGACGMIDEKRRDRKFIYDKHYGPHDMGNKDWGNNAQTRKQVAKGLGVDITVVPRIENKEDAIEAGRRFINMAWFCVKHTSVGVERLDNYRKKWNNAIGAFTSDPVHDAASHGADAIMCGACGLVPEKVKSDGRSRTHEERRTTQWAS